VSTHQTSGGRTGGHVSEQIRLVIADGVQLVKNIRIPMRDGALLAADLYMPTREHEGDRWPVVMEYTPYRKDDLNLAHRPFYTRLPRHGYVVARVDIRGTGASEGISTDEYTPQEQQDGYEAVEWLAQQPWCDGQVNIMGISYGGFTALQIAVLAPPHLTSIIPIDFTDDRYTDDCHYRGGLLRMYYDVGYYGGQMVARNGLPPSPEWSGDDWAEVWEHHLTHDEPYLLKWYRHQTDSDYWRNGSVGDAPERIQCPAFLVGGWRDGYPNPPLRLFQDLRAPRKVLIGPWNHSMPDTAIPGPRIDYLREVIRWLDFWCKGQDTGIMDEPPVVVFMQRYQAPDADRLETEGEWRAETRWPAPSASEKILVLSDGGLLEDPAGSLESGLEGVDTFEYDPTVGVTGGLWSGGIPFGLPGDQRPDEALSLVYTTQPLAEDVHILGWPRAILHVSSSASVIGFGVGLCDVAPDGTSHLVAKGMLNATRRESLGEPENLRPGEIYELDIQIDCTAWTFAQGHRIRLSIASADWPNVWPTPEPATNQVFRGPPWTSRLVLPVVSARGSAMPPKFHPSNRPIVRHQEAPNPPTWRVCRDQFTGTTSVDLRFGSSWRASETTVMERESSSTFVVDPACPCDASARGSHVFRIEHPEQTIESHAEVTVQATATQFRLMIELAVWLNDELHFAKDWVETVARQLL
jgi:putative CocE/NonD family hydrolase